MMSQSTLISSLQDRVKTGLTLASDFRRGARVFGCRLRDSGSARDMLPAPLALRRLRPCSRGWWRDDFTMKMNTKTPGAAIAFATTTAKCTNTAIGKQLADYFAQMLPADQMEKVHEHIEGCTQCAVVAANWRSLKAALRTNAATNGRRA